jgi:hypothetical protein
VFAGEGGFVRGYNMDVGIPACTKSIIRGSDHYIVLVRSFIYYIFASSLSELSPESNPSPPSSPVLSGSSASSKDLGVGPHPQLLPDQPPLL